VSDHLAAVSIAGLERMAAETLSDDAFAYYSSGARDEFTQRANRAAWDSWCFVPRVLIDSRSAKVATTILGTAVSSPIMVAPMAAQRMAHPDGELATARAAARSGSIMVLSMSSSEPIETVAAIGGSLWLQLYVSHDRTKLDSLIDRAAAAGAGAIVITVDSMLEASTHRRPHGSRDPAYPPLPMHPRGRMDHAIDWDFVAKLTSEVNMPIVLKGILSPSDGILAADTGCAAVIVSNHGGRQLDGAVTTAQALPDVVAAVNGRIETYVDGGIRRGGQVLKALALGARAVLVGRPVLWGLAAAGEAGAFRALDVLKTELGQDMRQAGVRSLDEVPRALVTMNMVTPPQGEPLRGQ